MIARRRLIAVVAGLVLAGWPLGRRAVHAATCTGANPCKACKNCNACAHCKKNGGTCSVCRKKK